MRLYAETMTGRTLRRDQLEGYYVSLHDQLEREQTKDPCEYCTSELRQVCKRMEDGLLGTPRGEEAIGLAIEIGTGRP